MINNITLREVQSSDLTAITELEADSFDHGWSLHMYEEEKVRTDTVFLIAEEKDTAAGFILLRTNFDEAELFRIAVRKQSRRSGLGTILLDEAVKRVKLLGAERIILEVREDNPAAISLYEKNGFVKTGIRKNYYNGSINALLMELKI